MAYTAPTISDFKTRFARDFPFGIDPDTQILDSDITTAYGMVDVQINEGLFGTQGFYTQGYLLLAAHYLVLNIRASSQGINGQYNFLQNSKGVGAASEGFAIPQRFMDSPVLAMLVKTHYGALYVQMILPQLTGAVYSVCGGTLP